MATSTEKTTTKPSNNKGLSTGAIVAIVIGSVIGGLALIIGGIFLVFFSSAPALQRSQRDTERKSLVAEASSAIITFQTNNRGKLPTDWATFQQKYLSNLIDPDGAKFTIKACDYSTGNCKDTSSLNFDTDKYTLFIATNARCQDTETLASGSSRQFALYIAQESGSAYCINN